MVRDDGTKLHVKAYEADGWDKYALGLDSMEDL